MIDANTIHHSDIFDLCAKLDDASVDMILCDLPYGTTDCSWDNVIPFEPMWEAFKRIIKSRGAIVLTATQPFASRLIMSNIDMFKYEWIWVKNNKTDIFRSSLKPLNKHENVLVFSHANVASANDFNMDYYPQGLKDIPPEVHAHTGNGQVTSFRPSHRKVIATKTNYPDTILYFDSDKSNKDHPTQKPVALFEYLIKTYTQPDALIFDPCAGSGTTAIASLKCDRRYIVGDSSAEYVALMRKRVNEWDVTQPTQIDENTTQLTLFEAL